MHRFVYTCIQTIHIHTYIHTHAGRASKDVTADGFATYAQQLCMYACINHTYIHTDIHTYIHTQGEHLKMFLPTALRRMQNSYGKQLRRTATWTCRKTSIYVCMYVCVYVCMYGMYMCVCMYVCMVGLCVHTYMFGG